jgi:hypothetical protein
LTTPSVELGAFHSLRCGARFRDCITEFHRDGGSVLTKKWLQGLLSERNGDRRVAANRLNVFINTPPEQFWILVDRRQKQRAE